MASERFFDVPRRWRIWHAAFFQHRASASFMLAFLCFPHMQGQPAAIKVMHPSVVESERGQDLEVLRKEVEIMSK